jgi:hypothetical protein
MTTNSKGTSITKSFFSKKYKHQWIQSSKDAWNYSNAGVYDAIWKWNYFHGRPGESAHKQFI